MKNNALEEQYKEENTLLTRRLKLEKKLENIKTENLKSIIVHKHAPKKITLKAVLSGALFVAGGLLSAPDYALSGVSTALYVLSGAFILAGAVMLGAALHNVIQNKILTEKERSVRKERNAQAIKYIQHEINEIDKNLWKGKTVTRSNLYNQKTDVSSTKTAGIEVEK